MKIGNTSKKKAETEEATSITNITTSQLKSIENIFSSIKEGVILDESELIVDVAINRFTTIRRNNGIIELVRYFPPNSNGQIVDTYDRQSPEYNDYSIKLRGTKL